jgi:pimeloyl-ACP methyl ester carboxylesterase
LELFYRKFGEGKPLFILHGLFGASDNWVTFGRQLSDHYQVIIPDMRNHGQSPHSDHWEYTAMADDIYQLASQLGYDQITILGHSMGGKVGMIFANNHPDMLAKLVAVDIAPRSYPIRHRTIIDGLLSIDLASIASRRAADDQLAKYVSELGVRQFLLKNLDRDDQNNFRWKLNLKTISDHLENVGLATYPHWPIEIPTLFIRGINSNYITDDDILDIREHFSDVAVESIGNAGHWVHAEQPEAFFNTAIAFLDN